MFLINYKCFMYLTKLSAKQIEKTFHSIKLQNYFSDLIQMFILQNCHLSKTNSNKQNIFMT